MERCRFCGSELPANARFCGTCGRVMEAGQFAPPIASISISGNSGSGPNALIDEREQRPVIQGGAALPIAGQVQAGHIAAVQGTPQIGGVPSVQGAPSLPGTPAGSGAPQAASQFAHGGAPSLPGTPAGSGGSPAAPQFAHGGAPSVGPSAHAAPGTPATPAPSPHEQGQRFQPGHPEHPQHPQHPQYPQHEHHLHHPTHEQHAEHAQHGQQGQQGQQGQYGQSPAHAAPHHIAPKASPARSIGKTLANKSHVLRLQTATSKGVAAAFTVVAVAAVVIIASMHRGGGGQPPGGPPGSPLLYVLTNGVSPQLGAVDGNGTPVWAFSLPAGGSIVHKPVIANGVFYVVVGTTNGNAGSSSLYALRISNGSILWKLQLGQGVQVAQPIASNGVIYISETNYAYALKASDGTVLWKYKTNAAASVDPVLGNGVLYVTGQDDNSVCALNISNGTPIWKFSSTISQLVLDHGVLYIVSPEAAGSGGVGTGPGPGGGCNGTNSLSASASQVLAVNASNGTSLWSFSLGGFATGNAVDATNLRAVVQNGVVYVEAPGLNTPGRLYALRADNGSQLWKFITSNQPSPIEVADGGVYFSNSDKNTLFGLRASDGSVLWQKTGFQYPGTPTVVNGIAYIANGGDLYALRDSDGSQVWKATGIVASSAPLVINGVVYTNGGNNIVALRASDGSEIWASQVRGMVLGV